MENDKTDIIYIINNHDIKGKTLRDIYNTLLNEIYDDEEIAKKEEEARKQEGERTPQERFTERLRKRKLKIN